MLWYSHKIAELLWNGVMVRIWKAFSVSGITRSVGNPGQNVER